jgi:hypothetical protein
MSKILSIRDIAQAQDIKTKDVEVPEWGGVVRLRSMTAEEAVDFLASVKNNRAENVPQIIKRCAINEDGTKMINSDEDLAVLKGKSMSAMVKVGQAALVLNGFTEENEGETKNV